MAITNKTYLGGQGGRFGNLNVSPTPSFTPTVTPTSSVTPSVSPTNTPTISNTPSNSPTVSNSRTNTPTISNTRTNTPTPSKTIPVTPTNTPSGTNLKLPSTPPPAPNRTQIRVISKDGPIDAPVIAVTRSQTATPTGTQTPTPTTTPSYSLTSTPTQTPTTTGTGTPTNTPTKTGTPTITASSTTTRTASPTQSPTETNTPTATNTPTPTITLTNSPTKSSKPTATPSRTPSNTKSEGATATPSTTPTFTPTTTSTGTPTTTPTVTPTSTFTPTPTRSPRTSPTPTVTPTLTQTYSPSPTLSPSPSYSPTPTSVQGPFKDVVAVYQFNSNLYDSSCNGYNLTTNPNYEYNNVLYNEIGKYGASVKFDGTASYQATYPSAFPNCPKITVLAWVKIASGYVSTLDSNPVYKSTINGKSIYDFGVDKNGYVYAKIFGTVFTSGTKINNNTWKLILWQIDTATTPKSVKLNMTVDGVGNIYLVGNISPNNVPDGNNSTLVVGGGKFNGEIDNLIIWNRILSDSEIATINKQPYLVELCPSQTPTPTITPTSTKTLTPTRTPTSTPRDGTNPYFTISNIQGATNPYSIQTYDISGSFDLTVNSYGTRGTENASFVDIYVSDEIDLLTYYIQNYKKPPNYAVAKLFQLYALSRNSPTVTITTGADTEPYSGLGTLYDKEAYSRRLTARTYYVAIRNSFEQWSNIQAVNIPLIPLPTTTATPTQTPGPTTTRTPTNTPTKTPPPKQPATNYYSLYYNTGSGAGYVCNPSQISVTDNFDGTFDVSVNFVGKYYKRDSMVGFLGQFPDTRNLAVTAEYPSCGWHDLGIRINKGGKFSIYENRLNVGDPRLFRYDFTI